MITAAAEEDARVATYVNVFNELCYPPYSIFFVSTAFTISLFIPQMRSLIQVEQQDDVSTLGDPVGFPMSAMFAATVAASAEKDEIVESR